MIEIDDVKKMRLEEGDVIVFEFKTFLTAAQRKEVLDLIRNIDQFSDHEVLVLDKDTKVSIMRKEE